MLTISQIAERFNISNRQVYNLIEQGYLNVSHLYRNNNNGVSYLFSEEDIAKLDIYSLLAELQDEPSRCNARHASSFKQVINAVRHYDRFLDNVSVYPENDFLRVCFSLFHLNHYAKTYKENSEYLYKLKNNVLKKLYTENPNLLTVRYLTGPDRYRVWLCEDCKEAAASSSMSYAAYIKNEFFCPKCSLHAVDKEYYSLIEFRVKLAEYKFTFHLPLSSASLWMKNLEDLPQGSRKTGNYADIMYMYGRAITTVEEQVFPMNMVVEKLQNYLSVGKC